VTIGQMTGALRKLAALLIIGLALSGCGADPDAGSATPSVAIPAYIQEMIAAEFPADGDVHVQHGNLK
jgi:hypothetical protein